MLVHIGGPGLDVQYNGSRCVESASLEAFFQMCQVPAENFSFESSDPDSALSKVQRDGLRPLFHVS